MNRVSRRVEKELRWLRLCVYDYQDEAGVTRSWEAIERTTSSSSRELSCDGVDIMAIVRSRERPTSVILVSQYRPPLDRESLEFPAGLRDPGETPLQTAIRELKEETGYVASGTAISSPLLCLDAGVQSSGAMVVQVTVDGDDPANQNPAQTLEDTESTLKVHVVPLTELANFLRAKGEIGTIVDAKLWTFATALSLSC